VRLFADGDSTAPEEVIPDWIMIGESVLIRPYNTSGMISFVGTTEFASGIWIGVELDTPTGEFSVPLGRKK
jgi:kinesin family protein 13